MIHALKILPEYFEAMAAGTKSFEVRKNDMPYLVKSAQLDFVKWQAKEAGYNIKFVLLSHPQIEGMRLRTILKDECIKTKEAREHIGKHINIIGIEEI